MKNMCDITFVPSLRKIIPLLQDHCLKQTHRHTDKDTLSLQGLLIYMIVAFQKTAVLHGM